MDQEQVDSYMAILVAEKSPLHLAAFQRFFEEFQLRNVTVTGNGLRAIRLGRESRFDLILVGASLAKMEGLSVVEAIREEGESTGTPIVFTFVQDEERIVHTAVSRGASAFLKKPLEEAAFRDLFRVLLGKHLVSLTEERRRVEESMQPMARAVEYGRSLRREGDFQAAEAAFRDGLLEIFCGLAEVYLSKGFREGADSALEEAERITPGTRERFALREESFLEEGRKSLGRKHFVAARNEFTAALTLNEENIAALVGLGEACMNLDDAEGARRAFERAMAVKEHPEDLSVYRRLGALALLNRDRGLALRAFDRTISHFPSDPVPYYSKSLIHVLEGDLEKALPPLGKALAFNPAFAEAKMLHQKLVKWMEKKRLEEEEEAAHASSSEEDDSV